MIASGVVPTLLREGGVLSCRRSLPMDVDGTDALI
jgi:hypothetical protein